MTFEREKILLGIAMGQKLKKILLIKFGIFDVA